MKPHLAALALLAWSAAAQAQSAMPQQEPVTSNLPQQNPVLSPLPRANGTSESDDAISPQGTIRPVAATGAPRPLHQSCPNEGCVPPLPPMPSCLPGQANLPAAGCPASLPPAKNP